MIPNRIKLSGFSKRSEVNGIDMPLVNLFLQKRWEDKDGNIYAKRIGTLVIRMDKKYGLGKRCQFHDLIRRYHET